MRAGITGLAIAVALALSAQSAAAENDARAVMKEVIDDVFEILREVELQSPARRPERLERLSAVADRVFDWRAMAKSSLGIHWRGLDEEQRAHFVTVFEDLLAETYMDDMDKFRGTERVALHGQKKRGRFTIVRSTLVTHSRERVPIDYTMVREHGAWRIHDISIEGVSLVNHYRKSFSRFLVNRDFAELMVRLERKRAQNGHR